MFMEKKDAVNLLKELKIVECKLDNKDYNTCVEEYVDKYKDPSEAVVNAILENKEKFKQNYKRLIGGNYEIEIGRYVRLYKKLPNEIQVKYAEVNIPEHVMSTNEVVEELLKELEKEHKKKLRR